MIKDLIFCWTKVRETQKEYSPELIILVLPLMNYSIQGKPLPFSEPWFPPFVKRESSGRWSLKTLPALTSYILRASIPASYLFGLWLQSALRFSKLQNFLFGSYFNNMYHYFIRCLPDNGSSSSCVLINCSLTKTLSVRYYHPYFTDK